MKPLIINAMLLLAIVAALCLFTYKFKEPTNIDKVATGLAGIDKALNPGTHLGLRCSINDQELSPAVTYVLTTASLDMHNEPKIDTTLIIIPANQDTLSLGRATILWQNKDDRYWYILINKHL